MNLRHHIEKLSFYSESYAQEQYQANQDRYTSAQQFIDERGMMNASHLYAGCLSIEPKYFLALTEAEYGGGGFNLIAYDMTTDTIRLAKREDLDGGTSTPWYQKSQARNAGTVRSHYTWFAPPTTFGTQSDSVLTLTGKSGDAGCSGSSVYTYDLAKNYLSIVSECSGCSDSPEQCVIY